MSELAQEGSQTGDTPASSPERPRSALPKGADTYIVSDLHLSEGIQPGSLRASRLEAFFYDEEFRNFCQSIIKRSSERGRTAVLVLNGDVFDFLSVLKTPEEGIHGPLTRTDREFGLGYTEADSVWKMGLIAKGHPLFFDGLASVLAAGHQLAFIRGNHDLELFWPGVQASIEESLEAALGRIGHTEHLSRAHSAVSFHDWFLYEEGRYWIEHGNQYERSNAVQYGLNPIQPPEYHRHGAFQLDYPIGSIFVRYVYNKLRLIDPYTTHFVTLDQYLSITYHHNFVDLIRSATLHFPLFTRAISQARVFEQQGMAPVQSLHEERVKALTLESPLGEKLHEIQKLQSRAVGVTKYNLLQEMLRPVGRGVLSFTGVTLLSLVTWFYLFSWIQSSEWLARGLLGKASLLAVLAVTTVVGLFLGFSYVNRALHRTAEAPEPHEREIAETIAEIAEVDFVSMGHTHAADIRQFERRKGAFVNSGTWIPFPGPWDSLRPRGRQFTFVAIEDQEIALRRCNDERGAAEPAILLEDYVTSRFERLLAEDKAPD